MVENNDMANLRKCERHDIGRSIIVVDTSSGHQIGVLVNISADGLMIAGASALEVETIYQLRLLLPDAMSDHNAIDIGVDCLWSNGNEDNVNIYWSGCHIIDFAEDAVETLQLLIRYLDVPKV